MRVIGLSLVAAALAFSTSAWAADFSDGGRRWVLVVAALTETGLQPFDFPNNTFSTENTCKKAGEALVRRFGGPQRLAFECLDRGSAI